MENFNIGKYNIKKCMSGNKITDTETGKINIIRRENINRMLTENEINLLIKENELSLKNRKPLINIGKYEIYKMDYNLYPDIEIIKDENDNLKMIKHLSGYEILNIETNKFLLLRDNNFIHTDTEINKMFYKKELFFQFHNSSDFINIGNYKIYSSTRSNPNYHRIINTLTNKVYEISADDFYIMLKNEGLTSLF